MLARTAFQSRRVSLPSLRSASCFSAEVYRRRHSDSSLRCCHMQRLSQRNQREIASSTILTTQPPLTHPYAHSIKIITRTTWLGGKIFKRASGSSSFPSDDTLTGYSYARMRYSFRRFIVNVNILPLQFTPAGHPHPRQLPPAGSRCRHRGSPYRY